MWPVPISLPSHLASAVVGSFGFYPLLLPADGQFDTRLSAGRHLVSKTKLAPGSRAGHASAIRHLGTALQASDRPADAIEHYRRSLTLLESIDRPSEVNVYDMACCHALIAGAAAAPGSGLSPEDAEAEAVHALALVRRAFAAGYSSLPWVRDQDTDLKPIRGRPDFQALMAELAKASTGKKAGS
jgi:hypothetical protein